MPARSPALLLLAAPAVLLAQPSAPAGYGFREASLILRDASGAYYLTKIPSSTPNFLDFALVAIHTPASPTQPILAVEPLTVTFKNGNQAPGVRYTPAAIAWFEQSIFPALVRYSPQLGRLIRLPVLHYISGVHLADTEAFVRTRARYHPRLEYEQPAAFTYWERPAATALWRPMYEKFNATGDSDPDSYFTAATARASRAATPGAPPATAAFPSASALARERDEHSARQLAKAQALEHQRRRPGVVYKTRRFWRQFPGFDIGRHIFNGDAAYATRDLQGLAQFQRSFVAYVDNFSKKCESALPPGEASVTLRITRPNDPSIPPHDVSMDARFREHYTTATKAVRAQIGVLLIDTFQRALKKPDPNTALASAALETVGLQAQEIAAWYAFFDKVPCSSATMRQMGENLLLASKGLPPLQSGAAPGHPNAAAESEALALEDIEAEPEGPELLRQIAEAKSIAAANPKGLPLRREEMHSFRRVHFVDRTGLPNNLAVIFEELNNLGPNIIHCRYGPINVRRNGAPEYRTWIFWYRVAPPHLAEIAAADPTGRHLRTDLHHVASACPAWSTEAERHAAPR